MADVNSKPEEAKAAGTESKAAGEAEVSLSLVLERPYKYDGVEVNAIKMDGIVDLTAQDLCSIDREMIKRGYAGARLEVTRQYALLVAARVNGKPFDYCDRMSARDSIRMKDMVSTFFYARG